MSGLAVTRAVVTRRLVCTATRRASTRFMATDETSVGVPEGAAEWRVRTLRKELRRRLVNHCLSLALCAAVWDVHRVLSVRRITEIRQMRSRLTHSHALTYYTLIGAIVVGDNTFRRNVPFH
jgi:hypothetical protein